MKGTILQAMKVLLASFLLLGTVAILPVSATYALATPGYFADAKTDACAGISLTGGAGCGDNGAQVGSVISTVIKILSAIAGLVAVIMLIIAGLKFMTAGGDASGVATARRSVVYAIIGLVIAALAQVIVHYFFARVTS